jgi:hypothetical protein
MVTTFFDEEELSHGSSFSLACLHEKDSSWLPALEADFKTQKNKPVQ